ncbi:MAG: late control protein D [Hyphomicrobiales bacterium]|nr:late control protein D [Hyphomicrobiales bacterium]
MSSGLPAPFFRLIYKGVDISGDLDPMTTSVSYTDNLHGKADEIDVTVQDRDGLWKGAWKPSPGDEMMLFIHDGMGGVLPCGTFKLDEPDCSGSRGGDFMTIRGLARPIAKASKTQKTKGYEKQKLKQIVQAVAGRNGLSVEGDIEDLFFKRVTQRRERDLEFLTRLAEETGHYFAVRDAKKIVFTKFKSVDSRGAALAVFHGDRQLINYNLKFKTDKTYSKGKATYLDQDKKKTTTHEESEPKVKTGDTLRIAGERMESKAHAKARVKSAMHLKNRLHKTGSIETVGNVALIAGNTVQLTGFGQYDGKMVINSATHTMTRSGYISKAELADALAK